MATYKASCALVVVKDEGGADHYFYRGAPIRGDFKASRLADLEASGAIEAIDEKGSKSAEPNVPKLSGEPKG